MKKMIIMAMMMTIAISASAMTYSKARTEALFLSDKMAYELGLTKSQYEAVYEIKTIYQKADYFYRPLKWQNKSLTMTVYTRYSNKSKMYRGRPSAYTSYKGGNNRGGTSYYKNKGVQKPSSHASGNKGRTSTNGKNGSTNSFDHNNTKGSHNTGIVGNGNQGRSGNGNSGNSNQGNRPQRVFR